MKSFKRICHGKNLRRRVSNFTAAWGVFEQTIFLFFILPKIADNYLSGPAIWIEFHTFAVNLKPQRYDINNQKVR